jgi:hypothetical protein
LGVVSDVDAVVDVNIYYAENCKVVVTTHSNFQDNVRTRVSGNNVYIDWEKGCSFSVIKELIIDVYMPDAESVTLNGTGNIKIINGNTADLRINLSGFGNIDARNYEAENVVVNLSGNGNIKTWVTKSLTGNISGVGDVLYKGNPLINNVDRTGIGNVRKL